MRLAIKRIKEDTSNFKDTEILPRVGDFIGWLGEPGEKMPIVKTVILWPNPKVLHFHGVSTDYELDALILTD